MTEQNLSNQSRMVSQFFVPDSRDECHYSYPVEIDVELMIGGDFPQDVQESMELIINSIMGGAGNGSE